MATALPILEIQELGADLAKQTVFINFHLGVLGNSRKVSSSQVAVDADKALIRVSKTLRDRLGDQPGGKPQRLRESTLQKLRDFLGTFDLRNVVDDQELKEQVDKARALLEGVSTDALRNMPLVRAFVREGMADLAAQMDVLAGDRVSRKFRFDALAS